MAAELRLGFLVVIEARGLQDAVSVNPRAVSEQAKPIRYAFGSSLLYTLPSSFRVCGSSGFFLIFIHGDTHFYLSSLGSDYMVEVTLLSFVWFLQISVTVASDQYGL